MVSTKDKILSMLLSAEGFLSGEKIGEELHVSRAAVANAVKALRAGGYEIESVTNRGYRLCSVPDALNDGALLAYLEEARMERVVCLDSVDSTNRYLARMALDGAPDGQVVLADCQTAGRGRLARAFHSPQGLGVYFSYLIRPSADDTNEMNPAVWTQVTGMTAVAVRDAIGNVCGEMPGIKWVNDLYLKGEKICGILTQMETEPESGQVRSVIIGIGVNVAERKTDFPKELRDIAGSLFTTTGKRVMRARLAAEMTRQMDEMRKTFPDPEGIYLTRYRGASILPGTDITVINGETEKKARAVAIADDYALCVRYEDGSEEHLRGGEVSIRRNPRRFRKR